MRVMSLETAGEAGCVKSPKCARSCAVTEEDFEHSITILNLLQHRIQF